MQFRTSSWSFSCPCKAFRRHAWYKFPLHSLGPCWQSKFQPSLPLEEYWNCRYNRNFLRYIWIRKSYSSISKRIEVDTHVFSKFLVGWIQIQMDEFLTVRTQTFVIQLDGYMFLSLKWEYFIYVDFKIKLYIFTWLVAKRQEMMKMKATFILTLLTCFSFEKTYLLRDNRKRSCLHKNTSIKSWPLFLSTFLHIR